MSPLQATTPEEIMLAVSAAVVYAALWYSRAYARTGEPFDATKFAATVLVGALVGLGLSLTGDSATPEDIEARFLLYVGVISLVEALLKAVVASARDTPPTQTEGRL